MCYTILKRIAYRFLMTNNAVSQQMLKLSCLIFKRSLLCSLTAFSLTTYFINIWGGLLFAPFVFLLCAFIQAIIYKLPSANEQDYYPTIVMSYPDEINDGANPASPTYMGNRY